MLRKCLPNCLPGLWPLWLQLSPDRRLADSLTTQRRKTRRTRCGKGLGSQGFPSPGSLGLSVSVVHGGEGTVSTCSLETIRCFLLRTSPETLSTHHLQMWGSSFLQ